MGGIALPLFVNMPYGGMFAYYATLMFGFGVTNIIVNTPMQVMLQYMIDDDYKVLVFSIIETMAMALMPLGMVLFGFLYDIFPAEWILIASSLVLLGVVLVLAKPSVIREAHPELGEIKTVAAEIGVRKKTIS
jgi:DHA3 family macrolide efflux protein-like MFS transporter